jgi:hypothetical protein
MGGKRLKFPTRKKFVPEDAKPFGEDEEKKKEEVSQEEHEKRMRLLKEMGILKE